MTTESCVTILQAIHAENGFPGVALTCLRQKCGYRLDPQSMVLHAAQLQAQRPSGNMGNAWVHQKRPAAFD